jgi:hypothetical protein
LDDIEIILTNCIKEIKSGKATLAECLNRYSHQFQGFESLLRMALNIQEPPLFKLDKNYKQAAKAKLLRQIRTTKQQKHRSFTDVFSFGIPLQSTRARIAVSVLTLTILILSVSGGTAYAAQSSLPGDLLYQVKIGTEDARLLIAGDSAAKAELNLRFAQTRLEEMEKLINSDVEEAGLAVNGYQGNLEAARQKIREISDALILSDLLERALNNIRNQTTFCDDINDSNPKYMGPVNEASTLSINEQVELLRLLANQDIFRAIQRNFETMQNRLQRAEEKANGNQYSLMQEALLQYQQFNQLGEQILNDAQADNDNNTEIAALSLQAASSYLYILDSISQRAPQEYQTNIETCRQITLQLQNQARNRYQHQGEFGQSSNTQSTPILDAGNAAGSGSKTGPGGSTDSSSDQVGPAPDDGDSVSEGIGIDPPNGDNGNVGFGPGPKLN